jgi:hypothetical protein
MQFDKAGRHAAPYEPAGVFHGGVAAQMAPRHGPDMIAAHDHSVRSQTDRFRLPTNAADKPVHRHGGIAASGVDLIRCRLDQGSPFNRRRRISKDGIDGPRIGGACRIYPYGWTTPALREQVAQLPIEQGITCDELSPEHWKRV